MVSPRTLILGLAALAAFPTAASAAAPHWSAPDIVFPADPSALAAPSALMDPSGRAIAISSDARGPVTAAGDASGHFAAPEPVAAGEPPVDGVSGAQGSDGTLAVGWVTDGVVKVAVRRPGASFAGPVVLTSADGGTPALAVAPDATVTAAWREKSGKTYTIKAVAFGPSGGAGDAQTFDTGTAPIDSPVAAASPDGSSAIAWRRAAPKYRVRVAIRPAGGQFGAATLVTAGTDGFDTDVNLAYASDGTLAAGWANENGAFVALRPAGGEFAAAQQVSAAGEKGFGLGLTGGPGGVLSAGFDAGNGHLRVADGGASGFGAPSEIAAIPQTNVVTRVHLASDVAGGLEAAWLDPTDQSIQTADRAPGGAFSAQRVGYGDLHTGTVSLAAGPANRAVVVWRVRDGSVAAAVRSETADTTPRDPSSPANAAPSPSDTRAPILSAVGRRSVKLGSRRTVTVRLRCNEACSLLGSGRILLARGSAPLNGPKATAAKTGTQRLTFRLGTRTLRQARAILKRRGHATARFDVAAKDVAGNTALSRVSIALRR